MSSIADLKQLLLESKQNLYVSASYVRLLKSMVDEREVEESDTFPAFYSVIDAADKQPGISYSLGSIAASEQRYRAFEGIIQLDADAPFVCTNILATVRQVESDFTFDNGDRFQSIYAFTQTAGVSIPYNFRLRLEDTSSGREFLLNVQDNDLEHRQGVGPALFDVNRSYQGSPVTGVTGTASPGGAPGHGPNSGFVLPAETMFPRSGSVKVSAIVDNDTLTEVVDGRFYLTLLGYKKKGL